ncbi:MAG: VCBS repeat-containing protein [Candidatus Tectomicrobia bacterium]|uniref:VCBS repeat-containing protein n=1 Tax=Tectimicrobiota bacterium TaxID=2528274 RepID=A0A932CP13_UNCTE|nr:VCBS repeat-containing protein [Candidatus Tectomicrobia bacterium]
MLSCISAKDENELKKTIDRENSVLQQRGKSQDQSFCRIFTPTLSVVFSIVVILMAISTFAVSGQAQPLSYSIQVPATTGWYRAIRAADMDHDGMPEVLIGNWDRLAIEIWKYDPVGRRLASWQTISGLPYHPHGLNTGDFDKDGDLDVVVAIRFYGLYLCTNNGMGNWTVRQLHSTYAWNAQVADFDQDGNLDIFASTDWGAVLLYGDGHGNFTSGSVPWIGKPISFNVIDVNSDGKPDLIGPAEWTGYMQAFLNLGNRNWSAALGPPDHYPNNLVSFITPSAGDLYHNGFIDQVAYFHSGTGYIPPTTVVIFEGGSSGGNLVWTPRILDVLSTRLGPLGVADLNDDGNLDIFAGRSAWFHGFRAWLGDGRGGFQIQDVNYELGLGTMNSFLVVDINGDGASDIVAPRHADGVWEPSVGFAVLFRQAPVTFVTGGGGVDSPAGADLLNASAAGPATFGFVSKYLLGRDTPSGNLEFQFKQGNLNFKSTSLDWLMVTGQPRAIFRGTGTINGANICKFEVDAWDGSYQPGDVDAFELKIFSCDSGGDRYSLTATPLTKGSIIIHTK